MDNLTHSLAGLMMADAAIAWRSRSGSPATPKFRAAALATAVFANNAPDLDFVYVGISGRLGYLLHHRGHTHTLAAVLPLALLCLALAGLVALRRKPALSGSDRRWLVALAVLGGIFHVLLDFGNNYGVHPFWPVYDGWFYGDAVFIIEPWLMIVLIGMAMGVSTSRVLRGALLLGLFALLALAWVNRLASVWLASALTAFAAIWVSALWHASVRTRWRWGGGALACIGLVLLGTRHVARDNVRSALAADPSLEVRDLVSTPAPGNPLCWSLVSVQVSDQSYVVRQALASGFPWLSSATSCRVMNDGQTAPLAPTSLPGAEVDNRRVVWGSEFRAPRAELERLRSEDCMARAFLRFARVPFWIWHGSRPRLIGDLRFDRSSAIEFAELLLVPDPPCPRFVPPWLPPLTLAP